MSQLEEAKSATWPLEPLGHLATHTPIQVNRQPDGSLSTYAMQHSAWRTGPYAGLATLPQQTFYRPSWQPASGDWTANNNKMNSGWDNKWAGDEIPRPRPQLLTQPFNPNDILTNIPQTANEEAKLPQANNTFIPSPKEEERKSTETSSSTYEASASQSLSDGDEEERRLDVEGTDSPAEERDSTEETIDVDGDMHIDTQSTCIQSVLVDYAKEQEEKKDDEDMETDNKEDNSPTKEDETSRLLLSFSQQSYTSDRLSDDSIGGINSAFSNIEPHHNSSLQTESSGSASSFCRAPGLGPPATPLPPTSAGQAAPLVCPICGFSCTSKFHYNSHMNTHGDHQCSMCDYTSRTEGRLKKHMRDSHSIKQQLAVGLELDPSNQSSTSTSSSSSSGTATATVLTTTPIRPPTTDTSTLSTTMANLVDIAAAVAAGQQDMPSMSNGFSMSTAGLLTPHMPSAIEQIRVFTENSSLLPDTRLNLANVLGAMNHVMGGSSGGNSSSSPEKGMNEQRRNSSGKAKAYKCKQCPHISQSKDEQWAHSRTHIPADKQMNCTKCNFVTEYKHHLEYHIRNHIGSKPFECKKCQYTCVNKSMLNSHMKSHTNIYQFRCLDCTYCTKYCHSLKLHLKKYNHRRVPDGVDIGETSPNQMKNDSISQFPSFSGLKLDSPNPATSLAALNSMHSSLVTSPSINYVQLFARQQQQTLDNLMSLASTPSLKCSICEFQTNSQEELMRHNVNHFLSQGGVPPIVSLYQGMPQMAAALLPSMNLADMTEETGIEERQDEHDSGGDVGDDEMDASSGSTASPTGSSKGSAADENEKQQKAFKLELISQRLQGKTPTGSEDGSGTDHKEHEEEHEETIMESSVSPAEESFNASMLANAEDQPDGVVPSSLPTSESSSNLNLFQHACLLHLSALQRRENSESWRLQCQHCRIAFQDQALYHIHMGYHGYEHVFKCNRCGHTAPDSLNFNMHLWQASHE